KAGSPRLTRHVAPPIELSDRLCHHCGVAGMYPMDVSQLQRYRERHGLGRSAQRGKDLQQRSTPMGCRCPQCLRQRWYLGEQRFGLSSLLLVKLWRLRLLAVLPLLSCTAPVSTATAPVSSRHRVALLSSARIFQSNNEAAAGRQTQYYTPPVSYCRIVSA